ncbi:MAG: translation initiation factor IF-3 [Candidatus Pacebacteria bacterium]|nr:translation initiation factor IF-3 [Candidatus Paceibacterota bacterium]
MIKRPPLNNQIRAEKVRVIDEAGKQLGVVSLDEALQIARERNLDLIQISEKADPPVCKIMDYGKFLYWQEKKEKDNSKNKGGELKGIRLTFNISQHDLETRANQAKKFLEGGDKIRVEMVLRGREKGLSNFAVDKIKQFYEILEKQIPLKVERDLKREPKGFTMIITKG